jgi:hypothetical protein
VRSRAAEGVRRVGQGYLDAVLERVQQPGTGDVLLVALVTP